MASETGNQSVKSSQSSELSTVRGNAVDVYPVETRDVVGRPVRANKSKDTDQLMGYLD